MADQPEMESGPPEVQGWGEDAALSDTILILMTKFTRYKVYGTSKDDKLFLFIKGQRSYCINPENKMDQDNNFKSLNTTRLL